MRKKLAFILIIMVLIVQSIGGLSALATGDGTGNIPEANISVKIADYDGNDRIYKDDNPFTIVLELKSDDNIVDVSLSIDEDSAFYIPSDQYQVVDFNSISPDDSGKYVGSESFKLKYKGTGNNLSITIKYKMNSNDDTYLTYSTTLYIDKVIEESEDITPPHQ